MHDKAYFISVHLLVYCVSVKMTTMDHFNFSSKLTLIDQSFSFFSLSLSLCAITFRSAPQESQSGPAVAKAGTAYMYVVQLYHVLSIFFL